MKVSELLVLTLDELGGFGALKPLEEQDEDLFPVLGDGLAAKQQKTQATGSTPPP